LKEAKRLKPDIFTKSGFMVGLGETESGILALLNDLEKTGCDIITIGQYLSPSRNNIRVNKYYTPAEFELLKKMAEDFAFKAVVSGIFVRSSYGAKEVLDRILKKERDARKSQR
jgi:lipoic acid synthetase